MKSSKSNPDHNCCDSKNCSCLNRCKNYAGISPGSVKCYWEQHNHETECTDEVYLRVAEDVTYKLWELGNAIKVYSRHSGGHVSADLVNEVMKDMNVPPVLGANDSSWDTVDYGGNFFFGSDRTVYLREEYLREHNLEQAGPSAVTSSWVVEDKLSDDLLDLLDKFCDAIFLGDEETFILALELAGGHPFLCGIVGLVLNKCTELLAFDYKRDTLERTMRLMIAFSQNEFLNQNSVNLELYYFSQIIVNLLLGGECFDLTKAANNAADLFVQGNEFQKVNPENISLDSTSFSGIDANLIFNATEGATIVSAETPAENGIIPEDKKEDVIFNGIDTKNEYEALFFMMEGDGFGIKKSSDEEMNFQLKPDGEDSKENYSSAHLQILSELKQEAVNFELQQALNANEPDKLAGFSSNPGDNVLDGGLDEDRESSLSEEEEDLESNEGEELCVIVTKMCDIEDVSLVCQCLGRLTGFSSYMYQECSYQVLKRIDQFFQSGVILLKCEYEWLIRALQAVWALGEVPFREFSTCLDKLHVASTPEWVAVHFNCCGIFLKDSRDQKLYEILSELCGDAILPFMLYKFRILKLLVKEVTAVETPVRYRIEPKIVPKLLNYHRPPPLRAKESDLMDEIFEDRPKYLVGESAVKLGFKFAGCRPVFNNSRRSDVLSKVDIKADPVLKERVVIAKRRLFRPLTNVKPFPNVYDISCFQL